MADSRPAALIVEDQPFVGMVASDILRESGYDTFHACDAKDAAALLDEHPEIQLVVTDAELSGRAHGLELARQVSRERPNVQLVVTAADHEFAQSEVPPGTPRGERAAELMGAEFRRRDATFDLVLASPARRVIDTIRSFEKGYGKPLEPTYEPVLYENSATTLLNMLVDIGDAADRILLV